ncbi:MAG: pyridoxal-phosphate dependent enzyme [Deltaproteobacteria bacterium]|nr:pyridoxal-phosphate dependent enzyme [Deltaproteobacteria bacterium]
MLIPTVLTAISLAINLSAAAELPLFRDFPSLGKAISRVEILHGPTPLGPMPMLEARLYSEVGKPAPARPTLMVKRDDISESPLGGNKARKLEFLLADIFGKGARGVVTSGMYGSNHALATAVAAHEYGLKATLILGPQPVTENVRKKLLAFHALGAKLHYHSNRIGMGLDMLWAYLADKIMPGRHPYYIPPGGSNRLGDVGYVNAFLELRDQLGVDGLPDTVVVPVGTMGTSAGLLVGTCLAGVWERVKIAGVNVADPLLTNDGATRSEARRLYNFIRQSADAADRARMPSCNFKSRKAFEFIEQYYAPGYGAAYPNVFSGMELLKQTEGLIVDSTYSAKAFLYFLDQSRHAIASGRALPHMLFWLTYNAYDFDQVINKHHWTNAAEKWRDLPKPFWRLFVEGRPRAQ